MSICARPGCIEKGILRCSVCLREPYCSLECQKKDWKAHKTICETLKKLSHQLQPFSKVIGIIEEIHTNHRKNLDKREARVLGHLISYTEYQLGHPLSICLNTWEYEVGLLIPLYTD
jgi:hypothetical protein